MNNIDKTKHYGFLPGCSLSSYNPDSISKTIEYLKSVFPNFSAVLKCCGKPTRDIGQEELFQKRFAGLQEDIKDVNIEEMILACPNCKAVFDKESTTKNYSLWEILPLIGLPEELRGKALNSDIMFTIHDSCSARNDTALMDGIRWILTELGYNFVESKYSRENTRCCGFGGQVAPVNPELSKKVTARRIETLENYPVVVYCSSCRSAFLQSNVKAWHILDLIWGPVVYANDVPPQDALSCPETVWHNRFETRKEILKQFEL